MFTKKIIQGPESDSFYTKKKKAPHLRFVPFAQNTKGQI